MQFGWNCRAVRNSVGIVATACSSNRIVAIARNLYTAALTIRVIGCVQCRLRHDAGSRMVVWADGGRKQDPAKRVRHPRLRAGRPVRSEQVRCGSSTLAHLSTVAPVSTIGLPGARLE